MGLISTLGRSAWRDFVVDGVPGSGISKPLKSDIVAFVDAVDAAVLGSLSNAGLAKAADYTVLPGDSGQTIYGSANTGTISFGAATGYGASHINMVGNATNRGWKVSVAGYGTFRLYPGQTCIVSRTGSVWSVLREARWAPPSPIVFFVDHATGSNDNDGLTVGSPFATIQYAINRCEFDIDCGPSASGPAIQVADGIFVESNVVHTYRLTGYHVIYIAGNPGNPTACTWRFAGGGVGFTARDYSAAIVDGFKGEGLGTGGAFLSASQTGIIDKWRVEDGTVSGGAHFQVTSGGHGGYVVGATPSITGSCATHWLIDSVSKLICTGIPSYNVAGGLGIGEFLSMALNGVAILSGVNFTGPGAGAGTTGKKFSVNSNSSAALGGLTLPGATAGTTSTNGIVV